MRIPALTLVDLSAMDVLRLRGRAAIRATLRVAFKSADTRPGLIALCDQGIVSVTNFATAVMIGRVCGKAELGVYALALTLITIATGIISTLISAPYTVFAPRLARSRRRRYLGSLFVHQSILSLGFALLISVVAGLGRWQGWLSVGVSKVGTITAVVIIFISLREFIRSVSFAELRVNWALSVDIIACVAQVAGMLFLVYWGALTVSRAYTILGVASAIAVGCWLILHRAVFHLDRRFYLPDLKRNWDFGKWVLSSGLLWQTAGYLFPWILAAFHGSSVTGVWAACSAIVALGNPVLLGLSNYVLPRISNIYANAGVQNMTRHVHRYSLLFAVLLAPLVIFMATLGERLLSGIYGQGFGGTRGILVLLSLNLLVVTLAKPYSQGLFSLECAKADTFVNVLWVALMIMVGVPAVRSFASLGAAATMLASGCIAVAIKIVVYGREARRHTRNCATLPDASRYGSATCRG
jgi:O-antigen/teichoic acid export membrane protein